MTTFQQTPYEHLLPTLLFFFATFSILEIGL